MLPVPHNRITFARDHKTGSGGVPQDYLEQGKKIKGYLEILAIFHKQMLFFKSGEFKQITSLSLTNFLPFI